MGDFIRGRYDPSKRERFTKPLRELAARIRHSAMPDDLGDTDQRVPSDGYHFVLVGVIVVVAAAVMALVTIPAAAFLGRTVRSVNGRIGPTGTVQLPPIAQRSVVLARDGRTLAVLTGDENRTVVSLADVPPVAQQAVLDIEDARFYEHHGIDTAGILRALFTNASAGGIKEGGSTITQQLVKTLITGSQRTIDRKLQEARLALQLERQLPKQRILELYLNEAYFGSGTYGIGTAAGYFFGVPVQKLTLPQAALLAGMISNPSMYDPFVHASAAKARRATVLARMREEGDISRDQERSAVAAPLGVARHALPKPLEPYFVEYVKQQILNDARFGATPQDRARTLFEGGLRIETTLDLTLEGAGKSAVTDTLNLPNDPSAALVSIEPSTGAIRAMVGGTDYDRQKFNLATDAKRQPGSTFKPFALVAALDDGVPPTLTFDTPSPITVKDPNTGQTYTVRNYDEKGEGYLTLRRATELSVNTYYVQLTNRIGPQRVADMAMRMGITSTIKPLMSIALGTQEVSPLEMASGYSTLANNGIHCTPFGIVRVTDASGKVLEQNDPTCTRVVDGSVAAMASDILQGVIKSGTGTSADIGRPACGKTGTTEDLGDAWFGGYTPQFATVVWMGFKEGSTHPLRNIHGYAKVFGGTLPARIWKEYMLAAHKGLPVEAFPAPPKVPQTSMPNVVGKAQADATKALTDAGFTMQVKSVASSLTAGTVVSQDPAAGKMVDPGILVTLQVSDGTGESPSPSPSPEPTASESAQPEPT